MRRRFLGSVFAAFAAVGLLFATARPAQAWWWGWHHGGWGGGWGWGYPGWGWGYGYGGYPYTGWGYWGYPYYAGYYYPYYYPYSYGYYSPYAYSYAATPTYAYAPATSPATSTQTQAFYYAPVSNDRALLTVEVPTSSAEVWIEGQRMTQGGTVRAFQSPPLENGPRYHYTIRAKWEANGRTHDQTRTVRIEPGRQTTVDFGS
jgi:uncharacterized protein (TIGR03000 family)